MRTRTSVAGLLALVTLLSGCSEDESSAGRENANEAEKAASQPNDGQVPWGYVEPLDGTRYPGQLSDVLADAGELPFRTSSWEEGPQPPASNTVPVCANATDLAVLAERTGRTDGPLLVSSGADGALIAVSGALRYRDLRIVPFELQRRYSTDDQECLARELARQVDPDAQLVDYRWEFAAATGRRSTITTLTFSLVSPNLPAQVSGQVVSGCVGAGDIVSCVSLIETSLGTLQPEADATLLASTLDTVGARLAGQLR